MSNGNWDSVVRSLREIVRDEVGTSDGSGRTLNERHLSILRSKLLDMLAANVAQNLVKGERAHYAVGEQVDSVIQAILEQRESLGVDYDADLIEHLTTISAKLFSIQTVWDEIKELCNK